MALTLPAVPGAAARHQECTSDIHCVTSWSRYDNHWQGVASRTLLDLVRPKAQARHVVFHSYDGYTTNVKLGTFADDNVLLAHSLGGQAHIPREHGGSSVRVVVPDWYFWKSAKWVTRIVFHAEDLPGFWETTRLHQQRGRSVEGKSGIRLIADLLLPPRFAREDAREAGAP